MMETSYQGGVSDGDNYQRLSQTITSNIKKISQNVSSMSKMVNQLQTPQDSQELRNQLRQIQNYTHKLAKDTSAMLMELIKMPVDHPASSITRDRLSDEYMATLNAFQKIQRLAAQKTKEDVRKVKAQTARVSDPFALSSGNKDQLVDMDESGRQQQMQQQQQKQQQIGISETELMELEERERDIRQLEDDIKDVNQIFKNLGQIIHDSGHVVDSIEQSVEHAAYTVEAGTAEILQASNYKNKLRKKKVYLAVIGTIIVSIIIIVIFAR